MANNGEGTDPDAGAQSGLDEVTASPEGELPSWEALDQPATETVSTSQPPPYVPPVAQPPEAQPPTQQWHQSVAPPPGVPPAPPQAPPVDESTQPPAQPPQAQPPHDQPTGEQQGPAPGSWTVPGSPPTTQQPIIGQPLGQPPQQYQQQQYQQYQQQQYQPQQQQYQQQQYPQQYQQPYGAQQQPVAPTGPTRGGGPMALLGGLLLVLGGAAMIAGSFLDWGKGLVAGELVILTGFKNAQDNLWGAPGTLAAGAVLVIAGVAYFASLKSGVGALKRTLALVAALAGLGWVVYLLVSLQLDDANALVGLWLCLAGAVLGLVGTFMGRGKKAAASPKT